MNSLPPGIAKKAGNKPPVNIQWARALEKGWATWIISFHFWNIPSALVSYKVHLWRVHCVFSGCNSYAILEKILFERSWSVLGCEGGCRPSRCSGCFIHLEKINEHGMSFIKDWSTNPICTLLLIQLHIAIQYKRINMCTHTCVTIIHLQLYEHRKNMYMYIYIYTPTKTSSVVVPSIQFGFEVYWRWSIF